MPGPGPKAPGARRRRGAVTNSASTAVVLAPLSTEELAEPDHVVRATLEPRTDGVEWQPAAVALWNSICESPQTRQLLGPDWHIMAGQLIDLVHDYHSVDLYVRYGFEEEEMYGAKAGEIIINPTTGKPYIDNQKQAIKLRISTEIRFWVAKFGLTPLDRYTLKWQIAEAEQSEERASRRRASKPPKDFLTSGS